MIHAEIKKKVFSQPFVTIWSGVAQLEMNVKLLGTLTCLGKS